MGALRRLVCGLLLSVLAATGAAAQGYTIWGLPTATSLTGNEYVALGQNQSGTYHTVKATLSEFLYLASCRAPGALSLGCVYSSTAPAHNFATGISTTGAVTYGQPNFSDLLGTATNAQLQNSSMTIAGHLIALGGVQAIDLSDLTGSVSGVQMPALTGDVTSTAGTVATTIAPNAVTYSKFQQVAASSLVGNPTGATANAQGVTLGSTLAFSGTALQTGAFSGDCTTLSNSFSITCTKTGGVAFSALATTVPGTGVATALGVNVGTAGAFVVNGGALGTPSSGVATNLTGLPVSTGVSGLGTNVATALGNAANGAGGFATIDGSATLTNKTISDATNTLSYNSSVMGPATQTYKDKADHTVLATDISGVDPTGVVASSTALNTALSSGNVTLRFPRQSNGSAATYLIDAPLILHSNTQVFCDGGVTLKAKYNYTIFLNANGATDWQTDTTPPTEANMTDTDITISGCKLDFTSAVTATDPYKIYGAGFSFHLAKRITITNNVVLGDTTGVTAPEVPNAVKMAGVADALVSGNRFVGVYNGLGLWQGSFRVHMTQNYIYVAPNPNVSTTAYSCGNINGVGTITSGVSTDHETLRDVTIDKNVCYVNGATGIGSVVAWNNGTLSSGSKMINVLFAQNTTIASGSKNTCYGANGDIDKNDLINNDFENCDTGSIFLSQHATAWAAASNILDTTSGSSSVVITLAGANVGNVSIGNYAKLSGVTSVGGLTLTGYYPVTAVGTDSITINAGSAASSTATSAGSTTVTTYWGTYRNSRIIGNRCVNCTSPAGDAVFVVLGPGNTVADNVAEGGTYGSVVRTSWFDCCNSSTEWLRTVVYGNKGIAGSGFTTPLGGVTIAGDNYNIYQQGYAPLNLDDAPQTLSLTSAASLTTTPYTKIGTGALDFNVVAGRTYKIVFQSQMTADATGGWKVYFGGSTATASSFMGQGVAFCGSPKSIIAAQIMTALSSGVSDSTSGCTAPMLKIDAVFTASASGVLSVSAGEVTASGTLTFPVGTFLTVTRIN